MVRNFLLGTDYLWVPGNYEKLVFPLNKGDKIVAYGKQFHDLRPPNGPEMIELLDEHGKVKETYKLK